MAQPIPSFKLLADFGGRALWGTDWPHPNLSVVADGGNLVDLIADNPRRLYGFAA
jgi:predicted TIM-barrel fold metal-dependent hydrolase